VQLPFLVTAFVAQGIEAQFAPFGPPCAKWMGPIGDHFVCTWAQDERPTALHMAQPNVLVGNRLQIGPKRGAREHCQPRLHGH
jgi:hypothetical protein